MPVSGMKISSSIRLRLHGVDGKPVPGSKKLCSISGLMRAFFPGIRVMVSRLYPPPVTRRASMGLLSRPSKKISGISREANQEGWGARLRGLLRAINGSALSGSFEGVSTHAPEGGSRPVRVGGESCTQQGAIRSISAVLPE